MLEHVVGIAEPVELDVLERRHVVPLGNRLPVGIGRVGRTPDDHPRLEGILSIEVRIRPGRNARGVRGIRNACVISVSFARDEVLLFHVSVLREIDVSCEKRVRIRGDGDRSGDVWRGHGSHRRAGRKNRGSQSHNQGAEHSQIHKVFPLPRPHLRSGGRRPFTDPRLPRRPLDGDASKGPESAQPNRVAERNQVSLLSGSERRWPAPPLSVRPKVASSTSISVRPRFISPTRSIRDATGS